MHKFPYLRQRKLLPNSIVFSPQPYGIKANTEQYLFPPIQKTQNIVFAPFLFLQMLCLCTATQERADVPVKSRLNNALVLLQAFFALLQTVYVSRQGVIVECFCRAKVTELLCGISLFFFGLGVANSTAIGNKKRLAKN